MITGEPVVPVTTAAPINGLHSVGGHARGDALICFDKPAFCSYGLKQAANASVCESAIGAVKAALDHLLENAPTLAGMKFVHWYDRDVEKKEDPILSDDLFGGDITQTEEELPEEKEPPEKEPPCAGEELQARESAARLVQSVNSGAHTMFFPKRCIYQGNATASKRRETISAAIFLRQTFR